MPEETPPTRAELAAAKDEAVANLWTDENGDPVFYTEGPERA